jgi:hypothetical protein
MEAQFKHYRNGDLKARLGRRLRIENWESVIGDWGLGFQLPMTNSQ